MKEKVLIAEDDPLTRRMLESTHDTLGYEVISTVNGSEALREVKNNIFYVIVSDNEMPSMKGAELLRKVFALEYTFVFFFLTGNSDFKVAIQLLKDVAVDYLVKRFLGEDLHFGIRKNPRQRTQERVMHKIEGEKALYTLEGYPTFLDRADWVDGTGPYLCRQIRKKPNWRKRASNGIDYTGDLPTVFVRTTMALPISHK